MEAENLAFSRPFDRLLQLEPVRVADDRVQIAGTVYNTGIFAWNNIRFPEQHQFRIGARVLRPNTSHPVWEGRFCFPDLIVNPSEYLDFVIDVDRNLLPSGRYEVEVEVLKEQAFWFSEFGLLSERISFDVGAAKPQPLFSYEVEIDYLTARGDFCLEVVGKVRNIGTAAWDNRGLNPENHFCLGGRIKSEGSMHPLVEARSYCVPTYLEPGGIADFRMLLSVSGLADGHYDLDIRMLKEGHFWFDVDSQGLSQLRFTLPIETAANVGLYECRFEQMQANSKHDALLRISGTVTNTGLLPWQTHGEGEGVFLIGMRIFGDSRYPVWEGRHSLRKHPLESGQSEAFNLTISTLGLPTGKYTVEVNMLKEGFFWFNEKWSPGWQVPISILTKEPVLRSERRLNDLRLTSADVDRRVLFVAPTLPHYDRSSGGKRLLTILRMLRAQGCMVDFAYEHEGVSEPEKYIEALKELGVTAQKDPLLLLSEASRNHYNICILGWHDCAARYIPAIREIFPDCRVIVDSVDIHWVRETRGVQAGELTFEQFELEAKKKEELETYAAADEIWVVTEEDRQAILPYTPGHSIKVVSCLADVSEKYVEGPSGFGIIYVGGFKHPPNESAALWAHEIVNRFRRESALPVVLYIVGDSPTDRIQALHDGKTTIVTGHVPDLHDYFERSRIFLAPFKYGAGLKGKICESICHGIPVITNALGNDGIGLVDGSEAFLAETTEQFVTALHKAFAPGYDLTGLNRRALRKVLSRTGEEAARPVIDSSLACRPVVIAIVTHNQRGLLEKCLDAVFEKTIYSDYRIAVVCNGCTDGSRELVQTYAQRFPGMVDLYFNNSNEFFVRPNNFIIESYPDHDVVMMNNDVEVLNKEWLISLYDAAYSSPLIGAAGGLMVDESGLISEAGAELFSDGTGINHGRGCPPEQPEFNIPRFVGYISGCLLYMKRSVLKAFGPLDEDFHPMYYEDAAWQYKLHMNGLKSLYTPLCRAIHREGSSAGRDPESGMKKYQEINRAKFLQKFSGVRIETLND